MLAKPEYSSPPDEVCCWLGRCGGAVAGREPSAQRTAGRGAAAKSYREDAASRGAAVAEILLAGAPWQSCRAAAAERHYDTKKESDP